MVQYDLWRFTSDNTSGNEKITGKIQLKSNLNFVFCRLRLVIMSTDESAKKKLLLT